MVRVLVCGDRNWKDVGLVVRCLTPYIHQPDVTIIHGAARGADTIGAIVATDLGLNVIGYPADWARYGRGAGPIRNQQMLDSGIDEALAFHDDLAHSRGTRDMVLRLIAANIKVRVIHH